MKTCLIYLGIFLFLMIQTSLIASPRGIRNEEWRDRFDSIIDVKAQQFQFGIKGPYEIRRNPDVLATPEMIQKKTAIGYDKSKPINNDNIIRIPWDPDDVNFENIDEWEKTAGVNWECYLEPAPFLDSTYNNITENKIDEKVTKYWNYSYSAFSGEVALEPNVLPDTLCKILLGDGTGDIKYIFKMDGKFYTFPKVSYQWEFTRYKRNFNDYGDMYYTPVSDRPDPVEFDGKTYDPLTVKSFYKIHDQPWDPGIADLTKPDLDVYMTKFQRTYCTVSYDRKEYSSIELLSGEYSVQETNLVNSSSFSLDNYVAYNYADAEKLDDNDPLLVKGLGHQYSESYKSAIAISYVEDYAPPASNPNISRPRSNYEDGVNASEDFCSDACNGGGTFGVASLRCSAGNPTGAINVTVSDQGATAARATFNYEVGNKDIYWLIDPSGRNPKIPIACLWSGDFLNTQFFAGNITEYLGRPNNPVKEPTKNLMLNGPRYTAVYNRVMFPHSEGYVTLKPQDGLVEDMRLCAIGVSLRNTRGLVAVYGGGNFKLDLKDVVIPRHFTTDSVEWVNKNRPVPGKQGSGHNMDDGFFKINAADCCNNAVVLMAGKLNYSDDLRPNVEVAFFDQQRNILTHRGVPNDEKATPWHYGLKKFFPDAKSMGDEEGNIPISTANFTWKTIPNNPAKYDNPEDMEKMAREAAKAKYGMWVNNEELWKDGYYPYSFKDKNDVEVKGDFLDSMEIVEGTRLMLKIRAIDNIDGDISNPGLTGTQREFRGIKKMEIKITDSVTGQVIDAFKKADPVGSVKKKTNGIDVVLGDDMYSHFLNDKAVNILPAGWASYVNNINFKKPGTYYLQVDAWDGNTNVNNGNDTFGNKRTMRVKIKVLDTKMY